MYLVREVFAFRFRLKKTVLFRELDFSQILNSVFLNVPAPIMSFNSP